MKVLMANNYHYLRGGSERVMFEEIGGLRRSGHEVATFSARHPSNVPSSLEHLFPDVEDATAGSTVQKVLRFPRLIANEDVRRAFGRALDEFRPDVVHLHNVYGRLTPVVVEAARDRSIPTVMTAHDYKLICPTYLRLDRGRPCSACAYGRYGPAFLRACHRGSRLHSILYGVEASINAMKGRYDWISSFICPSRFLLESFAEKGISRERLRLLRNFVAEGPAQPRSAANGELLYVGRLSPEKGLRTLLRALAGWNVRATIAGDGPDAAALKAFAAELGIAERTRFVGHCGPERLAELVASASFTVLPSECLENAPMTILESFRAGRAVIGSDLGGIPELVVPGETGLLFRAGDPQALRKAIAELMDDPVRTARMGANARDKADEAFRPEAHVAGLVAIYREALA